ncbi:MAG: hypothetical protein ACWA44_02620 [Thiotrichales bacterium]
MNANKIQDLLAEYLELPAKPPVAIEVPVMPNVVTNLSEAQETQALIAEIKSQNVAARREYLEIVGRRTTIENQIRAACPMNTWIPLWVNDELIRIGFETTDWPMHRPALMIRREGEKLKDLRHRVNAGISSFS